MKNKYIFSFKSVVVFAFCFVLLGSLVLSLSLPKKTSGDVSEPVGGWPEEEPTAEESPSDNGGNGDGGLIEAEDISNLQGMDQGSEPDPDNTSIGTTFTGPSGTTYVLQEENLSEQEIQDLADLGFSPAGVWVPVSEGDGDGDGIPPPPVIPSPVIPPAATQDTYQCFCGQQLTGTYTCNDSGCTECQCGASTTGDGQAQYRCMQCRCH